MCHTSVKVTVVSKSPCRESHHSPGYNIEEAPFHEEKRGYASSFKIRIILILIILWVKSRLLKLDDSKCSADPELYLNFDLPPSTNSVNK